MCWDVNNVVVGFEYFKSNIIIIVQCYLYSVLKVMINDKLYKRAMFSSVYYPSTLKQDTSKMDFGAVIRDHDGSVFVIKASYVDHFSFIVVNLECSAFLMVAMDIRLLKINFES